MALLDADDQWLPTWRRRSAWHDEEATRPGAPVGFVACVARIRQIDGTLAPHNYLEQLRDPCDPLTVERLLTRNCVFVSALVPRAAGDAVGWFDEAPFGTYAHGEGSVSSRICAWERTTKRT